MRRLAQVRLMNRTSAIYDLSTSTQTCTFQKEEKTITARQPFEMLYFFFCFVGRDAMYIYLYSARSELISKTYI